MSEQMLHIIAPSHLHDIAALVGNLAALHALRNAVDDAIESGTGGAFLAQSDGEYYVLPIVRVSDMAHVFTSYSYEYVPVRSERETLPVRAVPGMMEAIRKSLELQWTSDKSGTHAPATRRQYEALSEEK